MEAPRQMRCLQVQLAAERAIHPSGTAQALWQSGNEADLKHLQDKTKQ